MGPAEPPARPRAAGWARTAVRRAGYPLATTPGGVSVWTPYSPTRSRCT
jgi:hypothetical protein